MAAVIATATPVSADECAQRVAVLQRFKELLVNQRERFHHYLSSLEKQQVVIESGSVEELLAHVEREEQIIADIFSIQKVIDPLENMYHVAGSVTDDISALKITLESLKNQAATRSAHNRDMLSSRMVKLRAEIAGLKNHPLAAMSRSFYQNSVAAAMVDIKG